MPETSNLPSVRVETQQELIAPVTDSWTAVLGPTVELARSICDTSFVPEALRGNIAATTAAILYGREVGLPPMTSLGQIFVIKGKVGMHAEALRALVLAAGHSIRFEESTIARCVVRGRRKGEDEWSGPVSYTLDDAKRAGLLGNRNYQANPVDMLVARASARLCRMMFADVIHGMAAVEELDVDDAAVDRGVASSASSQTTVRRRAGRGAVKAGGAAGLDSDAAPPAPEEPPAPPEEVVEAEVVTEPAPAAPEPPGPAQEVPVAPPETEPAPEAPAEPAEPESVAEPAMIRRATQRMLFARFKELGIVDDAVRYRVMSVLLAAEIQSSNDLTQVQGEQLATTLSQVQTFDQLKELVHTIERTGEGRGDG